MGLARQSQEIPPSTACAPAAPRARLCTPGNGGARNAQVLSPTCKRAVPAQELSGHKAAEKSPLLLLLIPQQHKNNGALSHQALSH